MISRKLLLVVVSMFLLLVLAAGCKAAGKKGGTGTKSESKPSAPAAANRKTPKIDAVKLLEAAKPAEILGEDAKKPEPGIQQVKDNNVRSAASAFSESGNKYVGLQIAYLGGETMAKTREEWARPYAGDDPEMKKAANEARAAILAGEDISGLGDVAFAYELNDETQLVVLWDEHYQMIVNIYWPGDKQDAVKQAKLTAERVLDQM